MIEVESELLSSKPFGANSGDNMNIVSYVQQALECAYAEEISIVDVGPLHRERSRLFVEHLASFLRDYYRSKKTIRVLSKHYEENRAQFGLNELLYDVMVCDTAVIQSPVNQKELTYVTTGLWAIESEFERDFREALFDFNKLVLCSAKNCVLIAPIVSDVEGFLDGLSGAADNCSGSVYVVFVPHPAEWSHSSELKVQGHVWEDRGWQIA